MRQQRPTIRFRPRSRQHRSRRQLPYRGRVSLLSQGELAFFRALSVAIGSRYGISLKTRLADVLCCPPELWETPHGWRISQKHLDFVLYDRVSARIVAAIELDDRTHNQRDRRVRDAFLEQAFNTAGILLVRFIASSAYDTFEIGRRIETAIGRRFD